MLANFIAGFGTVLTPQILVFMFFGTFVGIIFGSAPGLSATMAVALCLPITFGMDATTSMCLLLALYIGGISGGLISAILLKIPGTPASIATTFDGHPMAERGEAKKAMSTGVWFSFLGGFFSLLILFFVSPPLAKIAVGFTPFDYFSVILFSLTMMAGLSGKSLAKGLLTGLLGLVISFVGSAPIDGLPRFTLGFKQLEGGFNLLPTLIGIFALSEIFATADNLKNVAAAKKVENLGNKNLTIREVLGQWKNFLVSSVIGTAIGIMPGVGGGVSNLIAYTVARKHSKTPEKFGTGVIDGIVASETANNASIGGAMVPLLSLGIPGDTVTAMLLGGLMIHGISPGPRLFVEHTDLVYAIFAALTIAAFIMLFLEFYGLRIFVRMLAIPKHILLPVIFCLCAVGAYGLNSRLFDIWAVIVFGILGFLFSMFKIPVAPFILGFILGPMAETNIRRGLMLHKNSLESLLTSPICLFFLAIAALSIFLTACKQYRTSRRANLAGAAGGAGNEEEPNL